MKRKKRLNWIIDLFDEFLERRLWKRFDNFHCIAIDINGEKEPILSCVMGSAGQEYGLMLVRGPEAVDHLRSIQSFEDDKDDRLLEADLLSISLEPFGNFPPDMRTFYRSVGLHPRHHEPVPYIICKPPWRQAHIPKDPELAILGAALESIVEADRRQRLVAATLDDPEGVCVVTPAGEKDAEVSVHRERLPRRQPAPKERNGSSPRKTWSVSIGLMKPGWWARHPCPRASKGVWIENVIPAIDYFGEPRKVWGWVAKEVDYGADEYNPPSP